MMYSVEVANPPKDKANAVKPEKPVAVVITNYNYGSFVGRAIESVKSQSYGNVHLVVVDDGSTDNSTSVIEQALSEMDRCTFIRKANGGQLSALNAAIPHAVREGDIVFFLDSDDLYAKDYVRSMVQVYQRLPEVDFTYVMPKPFHGESPPPDLQSEAVDCFDQGFSAVAATVLRAWVGSPTSGISMRAEFLKRFTPFPETLEPDWRIRADDCLVWAASLAAGRKMLCAGPVVHYRTHGSNGFFGKNWSNPLYCYRREFAISRLFVHLKTKFGLDPITMGQVYLEFRSLAKRDFAQAVRYTRISLAARLPFGARVRLIASIWMRMLYDAIPMLRSLRGQ